MIGAFRPVYRSKVSTCIVEYVGQYCESTAQRILIGDWDFHDSLQFMNTSFEKLVSNLAKMEDGNSPFYSCVLSYLAYE